MAQAKKWFSYKKTTVCNWEMWEIYVVDIRTTISYTTYKYEEEQKQQHNK